MKNIDVSPIALALCELRSHPLSDNEVVNLQEDVECILINLRTWRSLDDSKAGRRILKDLQDVGSTAAKLSALLSGLEEWQKQAFLTPYFPLYEGSGDETEPTYGCSSLSSLGLSIKLLERAAVNEVARLKANGGGAIFRQGTPPNNQLVSRQLSGLYTKWTGHPATAGRNRAWDSDTSEGADSAFIRFAEIAISTLRQVDPSIPLYTKDSIASIKGARVRRGKPKAKGKRLIKAAGT